MRAQDDARAPHEERFRAAVQRLFRDQEKSLLDKLGGGERAVTRVTVGEIFTAFDRTRWIRRFRETAMRELGPTMGAGGASTWGDLDADATFNPKAPPVIRALRARSQRFAQAVNVTTWNALKASLEEAIRAGETQPQIAKRVEAVMGTAIRSRSDVIARTETHGAFQEGSRIAAKETDLKLNKVWLSALDSRVRPDHQEAHGQTVGLDEDFTVGNDRGPGPGEMPSPEQSIQCRCTLIYERADRERIAMTGGNHADHSSI
jgi:SPP1 gp7 family putative phage head morphogenesis protein